MDLQLKNKVAIVTAASQGLGKAVAFELAKEGARLLIGSRDFEAVQKAVEEIKTKTGAEVFGMEIDVSQPDTAKMIAEEAQKRFGTVDILVTNSGGPPARSFMELSDQDWYDAIELNLMSVIRLVRHIVPHMKLSSVPRIVNIASAGVKQPIPGLVLSNTLRSGLVALFKSLSEELAGEGILLNTVAPGRIATARVDQLDRIKAEKLGISKEEVEAMELQSIPIGRYGHPEEFARSVVFLASGANTYITGQTLLVDGGMVRSI